MTRTRLVPALSRPAAVALALSAAVVLSATGPAQAADPVPERCRVFEDLVEVTVAIDVHEEAPPGPSVGDVGTYRDEVFDADGTLVARVSGTARMLYQRPGDGHLMGLWEDDVEFTDGGRATAIGFADVDGLSAGKPVVQSLSGTGGGILGWHGTRSWVRTSGETARVTMVLCADGDSTS